MRSNLAKNLLCLIILLPAGCSLVDGRNYISIYYLNPQDSSEITIIDTISADIEYEYEEKYDDADGVPLVLELLCGPDNVLEKITIDTLTQPHGALDIHFNFAMFESLCEYSDRSFFYVARFKLVLGKDGDYDRVVHSAPMHFYITNRF